MKIEQHKSSTTIIGDIQQNQVTIDSSGYDFIIEILSSKLYSNPIQSFLRETVSNAYDSHIEAGVDSPILLELGEREEAPGEYYCKIQDFGVGVSPERFDQIYRRLTASTKRESDTQIGGFGIGRLSALAYSPTVYITTVFDGIEYKYLMYKDGTKIHIDLLTELETTTGNGLTVYVPVKANDLSYFIDAINSHLSFFESLFVISKFRNDTYNTPRSESYNKQIIKKYKHFWVSSKHNPRELSIVLGQVTYPIPSSILSQINTQTYRGICIPFSIGELMPTPNREGIIWDQKAIALLEERLTLAKEEIDSIIQVQAKEDFTDIYAYVKKLDNPGVCILLDYGKEFATQFPTEKVDLNYQNNVTVGIPSDCIHYTFNGQHYQGNRFKQDWHTLKRCSVLTTSALTPSGMLLKSKEKVPFDSLLGLIQQGLLTFCNVSTLGVWKKRYIKQFYPIGSEFLTPLNKRELYKKVLEELKYTSQYYSKISDIRIFRVIFKEVWKQFEQVPTFSSASVSDTWIADEKKKAKALKAQAAKNKVTKASTEISVNWLRMAYKGYGDVAFDTVNKTLEQLSKAKKLLIYSDKEEDLMKTFYLLYARDLKGFNFIQVNTSHFDALESLPNTINLFDFMNTKHILVRRIATAILIRKTFPYINTLANITKIKEINKELYEVIYKLHTYQEEHLKNLDRYSKPDLKDLTEDMFSMCQRYNTFDPTIKSLVDSYKEKIERSRIFFLFTDPKTLKLERYGNYSVSKMDLYPESINLIVDYLKARKILRPDYTAWKKFKEETIFNHPQTS